MAKKNIKRPKELKGRELSEFMTLSIERYMSEGLSFEDANEEAFMDLVLRK